MSEARKVHQQHMAGYSVGMCLYPSNGVRDDIKRAGGTPKNHAKDNMKRIKQIQKDNKLKQIELSKPTPAPFKLRQFEDIGSKLVTRRGSVCSAESSRPETAQSTVSSNNSSKKNFIKNNFTAAKSVTPKVSNTPEPTIQRKTRVGQVPQYLVDRKLEWAQKEQERLLTLENEKIPSGMMVLPEQERLHTLDNLKKNRDFLVNQLTLFPVMIETMSMKKKKADIDKRLQDTEKSIALFSRPHILVKIGD